MRSEINVTPLIDVCLVLLIVFMVVTPLLVEGPQLVLPATRDPGPLGQGKELEIVSLRSSGEVFVGQEWIPTVRQLGDRLAATHRRDPSRTIILRADGRVAYRAVREILEVASRAGVQAVGLQTSSLARHEMDLAGY